MGTAKIESVLALLPELFPGAQKIPLANIRPNPQNPGPALTDEEVGELAENLANEGLLNPIKVMPDREGLFSPGVQPHSENPRLRADGRPWALEDFRFVILAGEHRWRAAGKLGWATIPAFVLNPTPKEAVKINHLDNAVRDRGWWAAYQSIEQLKQADPDMSQRQIAAGLKMDKDKVGRAMGLLPLLTPQARAMIVGVSDTKNKGKWGLGEMAASRLADLGDAQKPLDETRGDVEKALRRVVDDQMSEGQVKALVAAIKAGESPEGYKAPGKGEKVKSSGNTTPIGETAHSGTEVASSQTAAYSAPAPRNDSKGGSVPNPAKAPAGAGAKGEVTPDVSSQIGALMAAHTLGKNIPGAHLVTGRLLPHITNLFHGTKGRLMNMGVKNHLMGTIFTLLIFLFVGGALISFTGRLLRGIYLFTLFSPKAAPSEKASMPSPNPGGSTDSVQPQTEPRVEGQGLVVPNQSANGNGGTQQGSTQPPTTPNSSLQPSSAPQAGRQDVVVPSRGADANGGTKGNSALTSNSAKPVNSSSKDPTAHLTKAAQHRVQEGTALAADFSKVFYGLSYKTFSDWGVRIGTPVYSHYYGQLLLTFFPELKLEGMQKRKLDESFDPTDPPKVVGVDGNGETILVKGTAIIQSDLKYQGQLMAMGSVALLIHVNHAYPDHPEGWVDQVRELTALDFDWTDPTAKPVPSVAKPQGNLGQAVGAGVHDATDAVEKADAAGSAVDKAKNLLGF